MRKGQKFQTLFYVLFNHAVKATKYTLNNVPDLEKADRIEEKHRIIVSVINENFQPKNLELGNKNKQVSTEKTILTAY